MEFVLGILIVTIIFFTGGMIGYDLGFNKGFEDGQKILNIKKRFKQRKDVR